jgi:hypothetical protein
MSSTISPAAAPLPGQAQDLTLDDMDDEHRSGIRSPAAIHPVVRSAAAPAGPPFGLRRAVGDAEGSAKPGLSMLSVVARASALSHVVGQQKKRLSTMFWLAELVLFICFICVLSALLIESRDTTSIFT